MLLSLTMDPPELAEQPGPFVPLRSADQPVRTPDRSAPLSRRSQAAQRVDGYTATRTCTGCGGRPYAINHPPCEGGRLQLGDEPAGPPAAMWPLHQVSQHDGLRGYQPATRRDASAERLNAASRRAAPGELPRRQARALGQSSQLGPDDAGHLALDACALGE